MSWGAEDLSAALGASSKYDADGELASPTSCPLAVPRRRGRRRVQPVDGVFADFKDEKGLRAEARPRAAKASPASSPSIRRRSRSSTPPSRRPPREIAHAEAIVAAFEAQPDAGVLSVGGKMVDRPHLVQAKRVLERSR
jgi:citrate lyase subunit beta/citryl-CoA lyase